MATQQKRKKSVSGTKKTSGPKKAAPRKEPVRRAAAPNKRPGRGRNTQAGRPKGEAGRKAVEGQLKSRNQTFAILLFALSIFLLFLVLLPGENVWYWMHSAVLGLFGTSAVFWPVLLTYISIAAALEKPVNHVSTKIWLAVVLIILICASSYIFTPQEIMADMSYWERLGQLYEKGVLRSGGGLFSGLLGIPFVAGLGDTGAKILIVLLIFVTVMLLTGTSLIQLFRAVVKPVGVVRDSLGAREERREKIRQNRANTDIDIELDADGLPAHPVISPNARNSLPERNEKLERLEKAFSAPEPTVGMELNQGRPASPGQTAAEETEKAPEDNAAAAAAAFLMKKKNSMAKSDPKQKQPDPQTVPVEVPTLSEETGPGNYQFPPLSLLKPSPDVDDGDIVNELQLNGQMLVDTLKSFGVQTKIVDISRGPAVTRYELQPAAGVKISKITNLSDDIALNLAASGVRIEAPIPGKAAVGIEVPNKVVNIVKMRELVESAAFASAKSRLTVTLGRDIAGNVTLADLAKMPHVLIAGSTGSGKSVCINSLIISLLYKSTPDEVRFLMVDPKVVELGIYNGIPHLLVPVVTDPRKAAGALNWAVNEMLNRYKIFAEYNVRDLHGYNKMVEGMTEEERRQDDAKLEKMPQIVIIIDELADLMMAAPNEVEDSICRLAQMARAAGMHLVIATQRPSVDVITGIIKANIPSRIAFAVSSMVDSRTILDSGGAEKLLGRGDMLFSPVGSAKPLRVQGCFVTDEEIEAVVSFVKRAQESGYDQQIIEEIEKNAVAEQGKGGGDSGGEDEDPMLREAIKCVVEAGQASTSLLQRRLRLGYARAGRLVDQMEQMGVVGPHEGSKPRQVLMTYQQWLEMNMQRDDPPAE